MQTQSDLLAKFNASMAQSIDTERAASSGKTLLDIYPFERDLADAAPDETLVVDAGGGYGHLLREMRKQWPQLKGKMVLEDLPETVKGAVTENVEIQPYDFFKQEQPVKGNSSPSTILCAQANNYLQAPASTSSGTFSTTGPTTPVEQS